MDNIRLLKCSQGGSGADDFQPRGSQLDWTVSYRHKSAPLSRWRAAETSPDPDMCLRNRGVDRMEAIPKVLTNIGTEAPGWAGGWSETGFGGYGPGGGPMNSGYGPGEAFGPSGAFSDVTGGGWANGTGGPAMNGGLGGRGGGEPNNSGPGIW